MSGLGTTAVLGVLAVAILGPYLLMAGMALLAGGAMYVAGKAGTLIGKGIYNAHKVAENRRLEKARAELETVEGELKDIALKRHEALKEAEESLALEYEKAVEEREKRLEEAHSRLERADAKMEELVLELPKYFETRQKSIREDTEKEIGAFTEAMDKKCSELIAQASRSMESKQEEVLAKLDAAEATIERKRQGYIDYATEQLLSAKSMLAALEKSYDCDQFASTELLTVKSTIEQLEELLKDPGAASARTAASVSGMLSERVQILQIRVEQRTATFNHQKAMLQARLAELQKIAEASHDLKADDKEGILEPFVTEEQDAAFWSENRLQPMWEKADQLAKRVEEFTYAEHMGEHDAALLAIELDEQRLALEKERARVNAFLLSKVLTAKMTGDVIQSEAEMGWELAEEPFYHEDDARKAIELVFRRDNDTKRIIMSDEYDSETQQYKQVVRRYLKEEGPVDESKRQQEDAELTAKMQKLGHKDFKMACDKSTLGKRLTGES